MLTTGRISEPVSIEFRPGFFGAVEMDSILGRIGFQQDGKKVILTTFLNTLATPGCLMMVYCAYSCLTYSS
jgi:hypothetical protein